MSAQSWPAAARFAFGGLAEPTQGLRLVRRRKRWNETRTPFVGRQRPPNSAPDAPFRAGSLVEVGGFKPSD
jgi:hypothetical protein